MSQSVRIDKWLWFARFLKSRSLATALIGSGRLRVNGQPMAKAHYAVKVGDVLTFPLGPHIRVVKVLAPGTRRGPAPEARLLYEDLEPPPERIARRDEAALAGQPPRRDPGSGRPTKRERRALDHLLDLDRSGE
jgi:ribosome-associated heat shock protein Hsp15